MKAILLLLVIFSCLSAAAQESEKNLSSATVPLGFLKWGCGSSPATMNLAENHTTSGSHRTFNGGYLNHKADGRSAGAMSWTYLPPRPRGVGDVIVIKVTKPNGEEMLFVLKNGDYQEIYKKDGITLIYVMSDE